MNVVLLRPVRPLRVSPSWGIVREVALILLRLGELEIGGGGAGEILGRFGGVVDLVIGILDLECWRAGLTTEIDPAMIFLLLGFSTFTFIKSSNLAPTLAFCPS